jgi:aerobic carbon-monoxide dehydrogenase medium subunit
MAAGRHGDDMKAPDFRYVKPTTVDECLSLLAEHGDGAQVLAGGQSLMPLLNFRLASPAILIDINGLDALSGIREGGKTITIGALERHEQIAASPVVRRRLPLLSDAAPHIAHVAIRTRGTIGGSVALADPAAELPACCLALDARIELASERGRRLMPAVDYFQGLYTTAREPDELVTAIEFAAPAPNQVHAFREISRRRGDFAIAGLAFLAARNSGVLHNVRLALFGVADRPVLAFNAMATLENQTLDAGIIARACDALADELAPSDDLAYPADYKRRVAGVLLGRALADLQAEPLNA